MHLLNISSPDGFFIRLVFPHKNTLNPAQHPPHGINQRPKAKCPAFDADGVDKEVNKAVQQKTEPISKEFTCASGYARENLQPVGEAKYQKDAKISPLVVLHPQ